MKAALDFLKGLAAHNDRAWFEAHRPGYEAARAAQDGLVAELISRFGAVDDLGGVAPKDCAFRINRDVRFSADKSPYKTHLGALLGPAGRKSSVRSYYLHIEQDGRSMLAGGLHSPDRAQLDRVREAIAANPAPLRRLDAAPEFRRLFGGLSGEALKTIPRGYPKDHPDADLLRMTQYLAVRPVSDAELLSPGFVDLALEAFAAMKPLLLWLEGVVGSGPALGRRP